MLSLLRNHPRLAPFYIVSFLGELYFIIPIWLFFYLRVLSYQQAALLTVIQAITSLIAEIPTGAFSDLVGKRVTLILSFALWAVTNFMYIFAGSFGFFVVLEVAKGIAKALFSGAQEALIYDSVVDWGLEKEYPQLLADLTSVGWVALFIAAYSGGFLYQLHPFIPYILTAVVYFGIAAVYFLWIKEPKAESEAVPLTWKLYKQQTVTGFAELFKDQRAAYISGALAVVAFGYFMASEFLGLSQARDYGLSPAWVGLLFGSGYILSAGVSQFFPRFAQRFNPKKLFLSSAAVLLASFLLASWVGPILGSALILLRISSFAIFTNLRSMLLNRYISRKNRATALSTMSLLVLLPYSVIVIFAGKYIDEHSPNEFARILGVGLLCALGVIMLGRYLFRNVSLRS